MSTIAVDNIEPRTAGGSVNIPELKLAGQILQVVTSNKNTTQIITPTSALNWQDVSDMSVNITPATGNKVLVLVNAQVSSKQDYQQNARIVRESTAIGVGTAAGSKPAASFMWRSHGDPACYNLAGSYLDESPGGNGSTAITYKFQVSGESTYYILINRAYTESDSYQYGQLHSSITVMEIGS